MSRWALGLLAIYLALGLSPMGSRKAVRVAVCVTALVVGGVTMKTVAG